MQRWTVALSVRYLDAFFPFPIVCASLSTYHCSEGLQKVKDVSAKALFVAEIIWIRT